MNFAKSVAVPDHMLVVSMIMSVRMVMAVRVVVASMVVTVIPRVLIRATCPVAPVPGFAHSERDKITLRPQHP